MASRRSYGLLATSPRVGVPGPPLAATANRQFSPCSLLPARNDPPHGDCPANNYCLFSSSTPPNETASREDFRYFHRVTCALPFRSIVRDARILFFLSSPCSSFFLDALWGFGRLRENEPRNYGRARDSEPRFYCHRRLDSPRRKTIHGFRYRRLRWENDGSSRDEKFDGRSLPCFAELRRALLSFADYLSGSPSSFTFHSGLLVLEFLVSCNWELVGGCLIFLLFMKFLISDTDARYLETNHREWSILRTFD